MTPDTIRLIKHRTVDLITFGGSDHYYGTIRTKVAPLTLDEALKYADQIPPCSKPWWLVTGRDRPEIWSANAMFASADGDWGDDCCCRTYGIRPALVVDPALLKAGPKKALSTYSTDELIEELALRFGVGVRK